LRIDGCRLEGAFLDGDAHHSEPSAFLQLPPRALVDGAFDVVAKPFDMATLKSLVAQAMRVAPRP
jgi:hypothetical protein